MATIPMKDSDILILEEPKLTLADQFYLTQVLIGLGTTMKHMLHVLTGTDRVIQYPEETPRGHADRRWRHESAHLSRRAPAEQG